MNRRKMTHLGKRIISMILVMSMIVLALPQQFLEVYATKKSEWITVNPPSKNMITGTFGKDTFLIIDKSGTIYGSMDGENWEKYATLYLDNADITNVSLTFCGDYFYLHGCCGIFMFSADGKTWKAMDMGEYEIVNVVQTQGKYFAVSQYRTFYSGNTTILQDSKLLYSDNGFDWQEFEVEADGIKDYYDVQVKDNEILVSAYNNSCDCIYTFNLEGKLLNTYTLQDRFDSLYRGAGRIYSIDDCYIIEINYKCYCWKENGDWEKREDLPRIGRWSDITSIDGNTVCLEYNGIYIYSSYGENPDQYYKESLPHSSDEFLYGNGRAIAFSSYSMEIKTWNTNQYMENFDNSQIAEEPENGYEDETVSGNGSVSDNDTDNTNLIPSKLEQDYVIVGDVQLNGRNIDLNGYSLTIQGNFVHESGALYLNGGKLIVEGDYRMQTMNDALEYGVGNGLLVMQNENDYLQVKGNYYNATSEDERGYLTNGVMEVQGDVVVPEGAGTYAFVAFGNHTLKLSGKVSQRIGAENADVQFTLANVENLNTSDAGIVFQNDPFVLNNMNDNGKTVSGRIAIGTDTVFTNNQFYGSVITVENIVLDQPLYIKGDMTTDSHVRVKNQLSVDGNLTIQTSLIECAHGQIFVAGDLSATNEFGGQGLAMNYEDDLVSVAGTLTYQAEERDKPYEARQLKNGTIEVAGDVHLVKGYNPKDVHKLVLNGTKKQNIYVSDEVSLAVLDLQNKSEEGIWSPKVLKANNYLINGCKVNYGEGNSNGIIGYTLYEDEVVEGDLYLMDGTMDLNGYTLTVKGNLTQAAGTLDVNGGKLVVEGDYKLQFLENGEEKNTGYGILKMTNEEDYVIVNGDFVITSSSSLSGLLTEGILELHGNFTQSGTNNFVATENHSTYLAGANDAEGNKCYQTVTFKSTEAAVRFQNLLLNKDYKDYFKFVKSKNGYAATITYTADFMSPERVTGVKVESKEYLSATLTWKEATDNVAVTGYNIYRDGEFISTTEELSYTETNLTFGEHSYTIVAFDEAGNFSKTSEEAVIEIQKDTVSPNTVIGLVANSTRKAITLSWKEATDNWKVIGYNVYRDNELIKENVTDLSFKDENINEKTIYNYVVTAVDIEGNESEACESVETIALSPVFEKITPQDFASIGTENCNLAVKVKNVDTSVENYLRIEYYDVDSKIWERVTIADLKLQYMNNNSATADYLWNIPKGDTDIDLSLKYTVIDAYGEAGSEIVTYHIDRTAPLPVTSLQAKDVSGVVNLVWSESASSDCKGYYIFRRVKGTDEFEKINKINGKTIVLCTDSRVEEGQTYEYMVCGFDAYNHYSENALIAEVTALADTTAPEMNKIMLEEGTYNGTQDILVYAKDNRAVRSFWFYVEDEKGEEICLGSSEAVDANGNYTCTFKWDTTGLVDGKYTISVCAEDEKGNLSARMKRTYQVDNSGPSKVKITDCYAGTGSATITWENVSDKDIAGFVVEQLDGTEWVKAEEAKGKLYAMLDGLIPNTTYTYRVYGYDMLGNCGVPSEAFSFTTSSDTTAPYIMSVDTALGSYGDSMKLSMRVQDDASIDYGTFSYSYDKANYTKIADVSIKEYVNEKNIRYNWDTSELNEGTIYVRFEVWDMAGNKDEGFNGSASELEYTIDHTAPEMVSGFSNIDTEGAAEFTWQQSDEKDVNAYCVYRAENKNGEFVEKETTKKNGYHDTDVKVGQTYYYKVSAIDIAGNESILSDVFEVTIIGDTKIPEVVGVSPADGEIVGTNVSLSTVVTDNAELTKVVFEYCEKDDDTWVEIGTKQVSGSNAHAQITWTPKRVEEGKEYVIKVTAFDKNGNCSEAKQHTISFDLEAPKETTVSATGENSQIYLSYDENNDSDFSHYEIYRMKNDGVSEYELVVNTNEAEYIDSEVEPNTTYLYKVYTCDLHGNKTVSKTVVGYADSVDTLKPQAVLSESVMGVANQELQFDGLLSKDNDRIISYYWDFGDGTTSTLAKPSHSYKQDGTFVASLTVTDASGNANSTTTNVHIANKEATCKHRLVITSTDGTPLTGANVYIREKDVVLSSGSDGSICLVGEPGTYNLDITAPGYASCTQQITLDSTEEVNSTVVLQTEGILQGSLKVEEMTYEEMQSAGIDLTDPDNFFTYKYEVTLVFATTKIPEVYTYTRSEKTDSKNYEVISAVRKSGSGGGSSNSREKVDVIPDPDNSNNVTVILPAKTIRWAKNMYKVILDIQNIADEPFALNNIKADLSLPSGLSLAKTTTGQSHSIEVGSLAAREAKSLNWYIKADEEGEYQIDCAVNAKMSPTGTNISENYSTILTVSDLDYNGLHLYIMPEDVAYYGEQYYVQYQLVNESGRSFYQVTADFGEYQNAHSTIKIENVFGGEVVDTKTIDSAVNYYVPKASYAAKIPILMEGDSITIGEFKPGECICGTYVFTYTGGDAEHYGQLVSATVEKLAGSNTDMNVSVKPITGHMTKEQKVLPYPEPQEPDGASGGSGGSEGSGGDGYGGNGNGGSGSDPSSPKKPNTSMNAEDPINVMRGAFHTENRLMSMAGIRDIYFDINYDSTKTTKAGDLGYGWYHNYESYVEDKNGVINVYFNPQTSLSFIRKQAKELVVQGVYEEGRVTLLEQQNQNEEYVPVSDGFVGYSLIKNDTGYTLTLSDGSTYEYDHNGTFIKTTNLYGQSISVSYNGLNTVIKDDATNKAITLTKNENGYVETATDVAGNQVHFSYNDAGELEIVTSKRGITTTYAYDEEHRIIKGVDHEGNIFLVNTYDNQGRVLTQDDGREDTPLVTLSYADDETTGKTIVTLKNRNGGTQSISVNAVGEGERIVNSIGGVTTYEYDVNGNLVSYRMPSGRSEKYQYDENGNIIEITNNLGETITYTYNEFNQLTSKISSTGVKSSFEYNEKHQLMKASDNGIVTTYTYDVNGQIATQTVEGVGTTTYTYQDGNVTSVTSPKGTVQSFTYDTIGNVVQYVDGNGICTKYEVDKNGNVISESVVIEDETVATTTYTYDAYGNQTSITDANGNTTRYEYNADGYCIKEVRADNSEINYTYDVDGNLTKVVYPDDIATQEAVYDTAGNLLSLSDTLGSVTTEQFGAGGLLEKVTQANGGEVTFEYYANGLLKSQKDAEGNVYKYDYDAAGRIIKLEDATGSVNQLLYDSYGNLSAMTDGEGNTISISYNGLGQICETTDANGNVTTYGYDALGNCISQVDALGNETVYVYDGGNRVSQVVIKGKTTEEDHVISYAYNPLGLITQMTDAEGNTYHMDYDKAGNLTVVYDAKNQKVLSYEYDKVYNVITETDANGNSISRSYDAMGNCIKEVNAKGYAVSYRYLGGQLLSASVDAMGSTSTATYDAMGNLESFTNPNGGVTTYTYDLNGNMTSEAVGDYYKVSYTYNEAGNVATKENAKGQVTKYTYDKAGRMTSFTDELGTVSYTYDGNGNILTVTEEKKDGTKNIITRTYDALNRVKTYTDAEGNTLSYEYDCFGNLKSLTYPEGQQVTYDYNKNDMLICMTDWQGRSTKYSYDENSMLIKTERADGSVEVRSYEATGNVSSIVDKNGETVISSQYYTYDVAGNIIAVTSSPLETEDSEDMAVSKVQLSNVSDCTMEYDTTNRLIKYNGEEVKYDADGNMVYGPLNGEMTEFVYDCRNRLVQAGDTTYKYDAENNRIGMTKHKGSENETSLTYIVDSASGEYTQILMSVETDKDGSGKTLYYHYGANRLVAQEEVDGEYLVYHFNNVGSTTAVTNADGAIKYQYQYSPYGELIEGNYGEVAFLYNGQYGVASDDNGLYYMRARYYNIDIRRFINQDILTGSIESSSSLNRYAYVEGNPISYLDPFGLEKSEPDIYFQLDCGAWFLKTRNGGRLLQSMDFAFVDVCLETATEIVAKQYITGMTVLEVAMEIYAHFAIAAALIPFSEIPGLDKVLDGPIEHASIIDLDHGGDTPEMKKIYYAIWCYGYSTQFPFL